MIKEGEMFSNLYYCIKYITKHYTNVKPSLSNNKAVAVVGGQDFVTLGAHQMNAKQKGSTMEKAVSRNIKFSPSSDQTEKIIVSSAKDAKRRSSVKEYLHSEYVSTLPDEWILGSYIFLKVFHVWFGELHNYYSLGCPYSWFAGHTCECWRIWSSFTAVIDAMTDYADFEELHLANHALFNQAT